ncbi:unnamed protein product [marine sediment metagenome]|uniref:Uncharacterized protein n=1 Tax=marine sediment metagenome TaxID=412755 RepID=X1J6P0_9ZZZZ
MLSPSEYEALAKEIAGMLGMEYVDGELRYPASVKDFDTSDAGIEWIPIHKLNAYLSNEAWLTSLSYSQVKFWLGVLKFMLKSGRPPDIDFQAPDDVLVFEAGPSAGDHGGC